MRIKAQGPSREMESDSEVLRLEEVEERMRPGSFSQVGFLGPNERLADVLARDSATLSRLGVTGDQMADALEALIAAGNAQRDRPVTVGGRFRVLVTVYTGFQICPFAPDPHHEQCTAAGGARYASVDWTIRNLATGQEMSGPGLLTHLIRAHQFFEGLESPYRIDPEELARLLELGPFNQPPLF